MKIKNFIFGAVRGLIKGSLPGVSGAIEAVKNMTTKATPDGKKELPHNWTSIVFQLVAASAIVYAFTQKWINLDQLLAKFGW